MSMGEAECCKVERMGEGVNAGEWGGREAGMQNFNNCRICRYLQELKIADISRAAELQIFAGLQKRRSCKLQNIQKLQK